MSICKVNRSPPTPMLQWHDLTESVAFSYVSNFCTGDHCLHCHMFTKVSVGG